MAVFENLLCVVSARVTCGMHQANKCEDCPQGHGKSWCNGDCVWEEKTHKCISPIAVPDADLYELLEVGDTADLAEIKKNYRKLSVMYHPDKNPAGSQHFNAIRDAYEILSDEVKRILYDVGGMKAVRDGEQGKLDEGDDHEQKMTLSLSEFYSGARKTLNIRRRVICRRCRETRDPRRCKGCTACPDKKVMVQFQRGHMIFQQQQMQPSDEDCKNEYRELEVVVEPGTRNEDRIFFKHMNDQKPGEIPGHLIIIVNERKEKSPWIRRGDNLQLKLRLSLHEALLGFSRKIKHLDGHIVSLSTKSVTKPGQVIRIEGEGMPLKDMPSQFGNLDIIVQIDFPNAFTEGEREELSGSSALQRTLEAKNKRHSQDEL